MHGLAALIIFAVFAALAAQAAGPFGGKLTAADEGLRGAVRSVRTVTRSLKDQNDKYSESSSPVETMVFDRQGRKTEQSSGYVFDEANPRSRTVNVYDEAGHLRETLTYGPGGKLHGRVAAAYDERGRMVTVTGEDEFNLMPFLGGPTPVLVRIELSYGATGKTITSVIESRAERSPIFKVVSVYDARGLLKREEFYFAGELAERKTFEHDARGRPASMSEENPIERSSARETYAYDERGELRELTRYGGPGLRLVERKDLHSYEYDAAGNWHKRVTSSWVYTGKTHYREGATRVPETFVTSRKIIYY